MPPAQYPKWRWPQLLLANLAIAAAYVGMAWLSAVLAVPANYPSPVYPPSGISIALTTQAGAGVLPGVALGRLVGWYAGSWPTGAGGAPVVAVTIVGSVLQAWLGQLAFRRWIHPALDSTRDVMRFLLLAPIVCLPAATVDVPSLAALGVIPQEGQLATWISWWVGDTIGVLLAAPLTWIVCGQPRALWRRRAGVVALPLLVAAAAVLATYKLAARWEHDKELQAFRIKARQMADMMQDQFEENVRFLNTVAGAVGDDPRQLSRERFLTIAGGYVTGRPELRGVDWAVRVPLAGRAAFEDWARRNIAPDYEIRDLGDGGRLVRAPSRPTYFPVLYTTPPANRIALGLDFLGDLERASAVARALASPPPAASPPLRLVPESGKGSWDNGVVLVKAIGVPERGPVGLSVLVIDTDELLRAAAARANFSDFALDFRDITYDEAIPAVPGPALPPGEDYRVTLSFAGRSYLLRFAPTGASASMPLGVASWTVITAGLLMTGLLGALLLLISGERARIELLVSDRTVRLRDREARLQAILDNAGDSILTIDRAGLLVSANRASATLFGYPPEQLPGLPFETLVPSPRGESGVALLARLANAAPADDIKGVNAAGENFPVAISVSRVLLPTEHLFVCIVHDLTEHYRSQERIYYLAHYDTLTGLENRFALRNRLEDQLAQSRRAHAQLAVLFIDLDHFKKINDSFGHHAGDQLLVAASTRMKELLRDVDAVGRLSGDEFVIVLGGPLTPDSVSTVAVRVVESLSEPYHLNGATVHSGASVGVALYPDDGEDAPTLLRNADTAMYAAKREGRGNFQFFSPAMNAATHEHLLLEHRMWNALEREGFDLHLQAQVELDTGRVIGAEVLLRWYDPELGTVEPSRFIPIAEECGLIVPLGDWVLSRSMQLLAEWQRDGLEEMRLAVNLSARQFSGEELLGRLDQLLAQHRIDPSMLELEITETAAMRDPEVTRNLLRQLRARGFKVAIDDFGTGYSSLAYLKLFSIDRIKIDRGFVKDIETNPNDAVIVAATIGLAHSLGLAVIAEGVETHAQWGFLRDKRGDEGQGYLFARPMPAREFREFIQARAQPVPGS